MRARSWHGNSRTCQCCILPHLVEGSLHHKPQPNRACPCLGRKVGPAIRSSCQTVRTQIYPPGRRTAPASAARSARARRATGRSRACRSAGCSARAGWAAGRGSPKRCSGESRRGAGGKMRARLVSWQKEWQGWIQHANSCPMPTQNTKASELWHAGGPASLLETRQQAAAATV